MDFKTLIETHKDQVSKMDAKKIMPGEAYRKLQQRKLKLESAETESERQEATKVLNKAVASMKDKVLQSILNQHYKTPDRWFFSVLKGYFEYKNIQQPETIDFEFKNEFDRTPEGKVYQYFKTELVDKGFLSLEDLHKYLKLAFEKEKYPEERFIFLNAPKKATIINIFYTYYLEVAGHPHEEQENYTELLGEYFEGHTTKKVKNNFSRYYSKVRK